MEIKIVEVVGKLAEDKDLAKEIRVEHISSSLDRGEEIILNFVGVKSTTQSFIHALISQIIKDKGADVLDKIYFKGCNTHIKKIIEIVVEYMQNDSNTIY